MSQPELDEIDMEVADETEVDTATPADDLPVESEGTDAQLTEGGDEAAVDVPQVSHEEFTTLKSQYEQAQQRLQHADRLMPFATEYMQDAAQYRQWKAEQAKAAEQAKQVERKKWEAPAYDKSIAKKLARDEYGNIVIRQEFAGQVTAADVQAYQKRIEWDAEHQRRFSEEGPAYLREIAGDDIREMAGEIAQKSIADYERRSAIEAFEDEHGEWMYANSPTGERLFTEEGSILNGFFNQAAALGHNTTKQQLKYAWGQMNAWARVNRPQWFAETPATPAAPAKTPTQLRDAKDGKFIKRTNRAPGRGPAAPEDDTRPVVDFSKRARERAVAAGIPDASWGTVPE